jgi:hypothetical protein
MRAPEEPPQFMRMESTTSAPRSVTTPGEMTEAHGAALDPGAVGDQQRSMRASEPRRTAGKVASTGVDHPIRIERSICGRSLSRSRLAA